MLQSLKNIFHLGVKEIRSLLKDWLMLVLIVYSFTYGIVVASKAQPDSLNKASIAIVDDDRSQLTKRLADAFLPPMFLPAKKIAAVEIDPLMDQGKCTFAVVFPPDFQKKVMSGKEPEIQVNVDATRMSQAFTGSGYITEILQKEILSFMKKEKGSSLAGYVIRKRFNPNLTQAWFSSVMQLVNTITMLAIILTGSALIRERETGTLEHLQVLPVTAFEIMMSKIWSMMVVVLIASAFSLYAVIHIFMKVPFEGSPALFLAGVALHLFAVTSLGIFLACVSQNMPQLGMLLILVYMPMQMLSGNITPYESMPKWVQNLMEIAPTTHFVQFSQAILYRGAGIEVVWKQFLCLVVIGGILFVLSLAKFRRSVA